jgi:iron complex outermembrane recepter protein
MHSRTRIPASSALALGLCGCLWQASVALADESEPVSADSLQEVIVTGVRGSIERSLQMKKDAIGVVDGISAEDIGKFPDLNLSESLQRIPGVVLVRSEVGEGTSINVRGLGPDFTRVELNGMSGTTGISGGGPTAAQVSRAFTFQSIASELFESATVAKSPSADTVEGGLAGVVNLETPKPLGFRDIKLTASVEGNRGSGAQQTDPRYFGLISKNWDDRFGVLASVAYSKLDFATDQVSFGSWGPFSQVASAAALAAAPAELLNAATPRTTAYYKYTAQRENLGAVLTTQFRPSDELMFTLDTLYTHGYGWHQDDRPDNPVEGGNAAPTNYTIEDGAVVSATFPDIQNRIGTSYRPETDRLFQATLETEWQPNDAWRITPFFGYSTRTSETELRLYSFSINHSSFTYDIAGDFADFSSPATDFSTDPSDYGFNVFFFNKLHDVDKEANARLDFTRLFEGSALRSVQFGARYARQTLDGNADFAFVLQDSALVKGRADSSLDTAAITRDFHVRGAPAGVPGQILAVDPHQADAAFLSGIGDVYTTSSPDVAHDPFSASLGSGRVRESTLAGYVKANVEFERTRMDFGVRIVTTDETSDGFQGFDFDPATITPVSVTNHYTNFLPAANLRYELSDDKVLRATYSRTVTRPPLNYLNPAVLIQAGPRTGTRGNPKLQPYSADQMDLGLEWYFRDQALFGVTAFVKEIDQLITLTTTQELTTFPDQITHEPITGLIAFTEPTNGHKARVTGVEGTLQAPFYFLPGLAQKFGGVLNVTYADSSSAFTDQSGARSTGLPGLSKNSYNAVLYYDDGRLDSRLAYTWRDEYLPTTAGQFGASRFFKSFGQLDFSINYKVVNGLQITLQALNVTNEQRDEITRIPGIADLPTNVLELERRILLGARYSL